MRRSSFRWFRIPRHWMEGAIAPAKIEIVGIGVGPEVSPVLDYEKAVCLGQIQRAQN
jgi:hypothetical protein